MTTLSFTASRRRHLTRALGAVASRPAIWLGLIVSASAAARLAAAWRHTSPRTFPDEYLYAALARSLAAGDGLAVRGAPARFPAPLEPLLTAPLWLAGDAGTAYRLTQALHVAAMSLAALPVYWLARRVGVTSRQALGCGAFTVALPSLVFSSYITADAVAFPLALAAVAAGVAALDRPTRVHEITFVCLALLSTLARAQYAALPVAFVAAALVLCRGRVADMARRYGIVLSLLALSALVAVALGPRTVLGYYAGILSFDLAPLPVIHWVGVDAMLLAYAGGLAVVPGAVAGLALGFRAHAPSPHRAFAVLATAFCALLLLEAALYAANGSQRFQERYLITILPLLPVAFCAGARILPAGRRATVAVAVGLVLLSMRIPLAGYAELDGKQDSPLLMAAARLEDILGHGGGSLVAAAAALLAGVVAVGAALRPRLGAPLALAAGTIAVTAASVGATSFDMRASKRMEATFADRGSWTWVDDAALGPGAVLATPGTDRSAASVHLFWNRDLARVLRMPGSPTIDAFGDTLTTVAADGRLLAGGAPVRGPLLVEESASLARLDDARLVRRTPSASLWLPRGDARIAMLTAGRALDGWLDPVARISIWPRRGAPRDGIVRLRFQLPAGVPAAVIDVTAPRFDRRIVVRPGQLRRVDVPFHAAAGPTHVVLRGKTVLLDGGRAIVARMERPMLIPKRTSSPPALLPIEVT